ncbi:ShlB/FhaC/HecB family hemolysin secretion/activation protein [Croceicoccus bisphenolivorans]|uniref:ShlB/FhaC/HecB family hemolysin secretion/activation protein n=1 Tax=Croceicoccus bisphenolivorans TaxID=1783232 RepID=UPI0008297D14|nr:ShlB/FhaC/HecB family hemolysin secretion/activation protein [Croceicoccus bisphenolivorans]
MTKFAQVRAIAGLAMTGASLLPAVALAQAAPSVPQNALPSREEIERGVTEGALSELDNSAIATGEIERAPCPLAAPEFADITFTLQNVVFTGLEPFPAGLDLSPAWSGMTGKTMPVAAVCEVRDRAATMLRNMGYLAAVQVPPQTIEDGTLRLDVLAARITRLQVKGDAGANEGILLRYLSPLTEQPVFNSHDAERTLLLTRDLPGIDSRLSLRPVEGSPGELVGEVSVRRLPWTADVLAQNYNSDSTGPWSLMGRARFAGYTGMGDATTLSLVYSNDFKEQMVFQVGHEFRVGRNGLRIAGDFTYADTEPTIAGTNPFNSETVAGTIRADYPMVRSRTENLFVGGGFDIVDQDVKFGGATLTQDKLRIAWLRMDFATIDPLSADGRGGYNAVEPRFAFAGGLELRHGLDVLGASTDCSKNFAACAGPDGNFTSRIDGDPTAFVLRADANVAYRPVPAISLNLQPRLQWSQHALLSYEEMAGGNYTVGRGYDPGTVLGDSAFGFRSEVRYGSAWPEVAAGHALQPYAFFDAGWFWNEDAGFEQFNPEKLYSAGGGVRANLMDRYRIDAALAVPLRDTLFDPDAKGDVRVLVSLSMQLAQ